MVKLKHVSIAFFAIIFLIPFSFAATLTVDGNDLACGDINGTPYCTIQAALNDASSQDIVFVKNGTYVEALSIVKSNITLLGESRDGVIVDGNNASYTLFANANKTNVSYLTLVDASAFTVHVESSYDFFIAHVRAIGQGQFYNNSNNGVGGVDFINAHNTNVHYILSEQHSKNGLSFTGSTNANISNINLRDNGQTEGWAGIALYTFSPFFPGNTTGILISGNNVINNTPMGIYMEDFIGFEVNALNIGTVLFSGQTVAPLVNLGLGVTNSDAFAISLGLIAKLTGAVPGFLGAGYYKTIADAVAAFSLALSPSTTTIFNLIEPYFVVSEGMNISAAIAAAETNDVVFFLNGMHNLSRVTIDKNLSFYGESKAGAILNSVEDTGSLGDDRAWILVDSGIVFNVMNLTFDGDGNEIYQAIRHKGNGSLHGVGFQNILFQESGPAYSGVGIAAFGTGNVNVFDSMFMNIGRIGVLYFGTGITDSVFDNNLYVGKGVGDFLDYALDISAGAIVTATNNDISNNKGVASVDNSTSACILVTTFFGPGTTATILNNELHDCTTGIAVGFNPSDASSVVANFNSITGNDNGVVSIAAQVDARFNWWGSCDGPSGEGPGSGDSVSTNVTFDPWDGKGGNASIGVCLEKTNISCVFKSDNVTVSVDLGSQANDVDAVTLLYYINGALNTRPMQQFGTEYRAELLSSELPVSSEVIWNVLVNVTGNNSIINGNKTFYVANDSYASVNPPVPDGLAGWYVNPPTWFLNSDVNASGTFYSWENDVLIPYTGPFGLENISNLDPITAGTLGLHFFSDFGVCNETELTEIYYVDLVAPRIIPLYPTNASTIYNNNVPNITIHIDDIYQSNSGVNLSTIVVMVDNVTVTPTLSSVNSEIDVTLWIDSLNLSDGMHTVFVSVSDIAGHSSNLTYSFTIESTNLLSLQVHAPLDGTFGSRRILFNVSLENVTEKLEVIRSNDVRPRTVLLCRNCDGYDLNRASTRVLREGFNNLTFRSTDQFGTVEEVSRTIFVDTRKPRISRIEPRRNSVFNGTGFSVRYTENNLQGVTLFYGTMNESLTCTLGSNQVCSVDVDLSAFDGQTINYYFEVADAVRSVSSRVYPITVDTTHPTLVVNEPVNGTSYDRRVPFNITASEKVTLEFLDASSSRPRWRRLCTNCFEYGFDRNRVKSFRDGNQDVLIRATDKAGHQTVEARNFDVT